MTRPIELKSKILIAWCFSIVLGLNTIPAHAQDASNQVDQFLNAFRGKPVGPISPPPAAIASTEPQTPSPAQAQMAGTSQSARTDCPAGMGPGPYGCVPTAMPPNAHRVSPDGQWQCDDGYLRFGAVCMSMQTPPNAHLTGTGSNWECNTGYRRLGNVCVAINMPPNAHLADTLNGWTCDSGHRSIGNLCVAQ